MEQALRFCCWYFAVGAEHRRHGQWQNHLALPGSGAIRGAGKSIKASFANAKGSREGAGAQSRPALSEPGRQHARCGSDQTLDAKNIWPEIADKAARPQDGQEASNALNQFGRRCEDYSTETRMMPACIMPSARAALTDRSITLPRTNGPRSLTRHWIERPSWRTVTMLPNGLVRCAHVIPCPRPP